LRSFTARLFSETGNEMKIRLTLSLVIAACVASWTGERVGDDEASRASSVAAAEARFDTKSKTMQAEAKPFNSATSRWSTSSSDEDENLKAGTLKTLIINGNEYRFRYCPPGTFLMGSPESEENRSDDEVQRRVTITEGFWTLETEVTQAMWTSVTGNNPSAFSADGLYSAWVRKRDTSDFPVEQVSWNDCQSFVEKLNSGDFAPKGFKFRLPTEAEWEYACRAGATTPFFWGSSLNGAKANCDGSYPYGTETAGAYLGRPEKVGRYAPNAWGLRDMHGNVLEWCADWYDANYYKSSGDVLNPRNVTKTDAGRVARGGGWSDGAACCRAACRRGFDASFRYSAFGFRLVLYSVPLR